MNDTCIQEYAAMSSDSALIGSYSNPYSCLTLNGYQHEKKPYPMRDKEGREIGARGGKSGNNDGDDEGERHESGLAGAVIWGAIALALLLMVIVLCRYLNTQNAKERDDKQTLEESLRYIDLMNDVYFHRIADIIDQESLKVAAKDSTIGHLARNIASESGSSRDSQNKKTVDICRPIPSDVVGQIQQVQLDIDVDINEIIKTHADIKDGEWKPQDCISTHRVALIIPYRDRWSHLKVLLHYLLPVLKRQQLHFRVFVVEQFGNQTFNKGRIMNAAFREAMKLFNFQCVIFHDVDLVPEDDRNMYTCAEHPKHMSTAIDKFSYRLPYQGLVGGVLSFRAEHFQAVNGYSNMYWGWGGEDDDMTVRILHRGLRIFRPPSNVARYKMVKHGSRQLSELRLKLLRTAARRSRVEGLNNVPYELLFTHKENLFTHFMVGVGNP